MSEREAQGDARARPRPLAGRTIVVTRSREQASELSRRLVGLGAQVIEIPTIAIVPPCSYEPLDRALGELASFDWLIATSANTARVLGERLGLLPGRGLRQPRTVAVGPATAAALRAIGFDVDLMPESAVAESIVAAIEGKVRGQRVLLARAEVARDLLPSALRQAGADVTVVDAYRTVLAEESAGLVAATFGANRLDQGEGRIDALTFTSSSTVHNLAALLHVARVPWPREAMVFSIGPITSATLREHGVRPHGEAVRHDMEGLMEAVVLGLGRRI